MGRWIGLSSPVSITILLNTMPFQLPVSYQKHFTTGMVFAAVWNCMIIEVKRDLRKSLVHHPLKRRSDMKLDQITQRFFLEEKSFSNWSWKPPKMETAQPLCITCCNPWQSTGLKSFSYVSFINKFMLVVSFIATIRHHKGLPCLFITSL